MASPRRGGQARLAARLAVALAAVAGARALLLQRSRPLSSYAALRSVAGAGAATRRGPREPRGPRAAVRMSSTPPGLRRVVVTGMGITSCLGNTVEDVKDSLYNARSGLEYNPKYAEMGLRSQVCGRPNISDDEINKRINRKALRFMGDNAKFAFLSMQDAIASSGLTEEQYQGPRTAGILGQGGTSLIDVTEAVDAVFKGAEGLKPGGVNKLMGVGPYRVTKTMGSTVSAVLSTMFKLQGPSYSISSACSTGAHCIGTGMEQIQLGKSDIVFAGAGEAECWQFTAMFDAMGALSTSYNDSPQTASRAFDKTRDGFCIAGGGGVVVLEELEHAKARGAPILGELVAYAANSDGFDMVAPSGTGGENCMRLALDMAKAIGGDKKVDYINTHGTSTPIGDIKELGAVKTVFDEQGYQPNVGSTKSLSGHALGAAGVHEAIYSLIMLNNDFLAESANINELVDEAEGMNILCKRYDGPVERVMSNSFGFGGTNCCLIFDKYRGD